VTRWQPFLRGHGTANDFVLLPDHDASTYGRALDPVLVRALTDRRRGLGGDGVIRVVRTAALGAIGAMPIEPAGSSHGESPEWFMDYVNADGSTAEMCGNGIRVLARHLLDADLAPADAPVRIGTRGGVLTVTPESDGTFSVDMGAADPQLSGHAVQVRTATLRARGTSVAVPNPHAVVAVDDLADAGPLTDAPSVTPAVLYPHGTNVEFVVRRGPGHLALRVWERGVGETPSCGTGVCAAAWVAMREDGAAPGTTYRVEVPGGTLHVSARRDGALVLRGPAEVVAAGEVDLDAVIARGGVLAAELG
jgi:diaminopimelate epimerase